MPMNQNSVFICKVVRNLVKSNLLLGYTCRMSEDSEEGSTYLDDFLKEEGLVKNPIEDSETFLDEVALLTELFPEVEWDISEISDALFKDPEQVQNIIYDLIKEQHGDPDA